MLATRKAQELDVVELIEDLPEHGLKRGERGTVVVAFDEPDEAYDIEFVDEFGKSRFAYAVTPGQIRSAIETARGALENGIKLFSAGQDGKATEEIQLAMQLIPKSLEEFHDRTVASFESKGLDEEMETHERFIKAMRMILRLQPGFLLARRNLALGFEHQGFLAAIGGDHHTAVAKFQIALAIADSPANELADMAAHIRHNLATAWVQLGLKASQKSDFEEARNYMWFAYETDPNEVTKCAFAMSYASLASWWLDQGNFEASKESLLLAQDIYGGATESYEPQLDDPVVLSRAILRFFDRGTSDISIDLPTKQMRIATAQVKPQRYERLLESA